MTGNMMRQEAVIRTRGLCTSLSAKYNEVAGCWPQVPSLLACASENQTLCPAQLHLELLP